MRAGTPKGGLPSFDKIVAVEQPVFTRPSFVGTINDIKVMYAKRHGSISIGLLGMVTSWASSAIWLSNGELYTFGDYALGDGDADAPRIYPALVNVMEDGETTARRIQQVTMFWDTTNALDSLGQVWACHDNTYGQYGMGADYNNRPPIDGRDWGWWEMEFGWGAGHFLGEHEFIKISAGAAHVMGLRSDGTLWGWGLSWGGYLVADGNRQCEKGLGSVEQGGPVLGGGYVSLYPEQEFLGKTDWVDVASGWNFTLAIDSSGRLWGTGNASFGNMGIPYYAGLPFAPPHKSIFTQIKHPFGSGESDNDWVKVKVGEVHAIIQKADGRLFGLGDNNEGQLGLGANWQDESIEPEQSGIAWTLHGGLGNSGIWGGLQGVECWDLGGFGYLWSAVAGGGWEGHQVQDFACTSYGTMVLLTDGRLMSTGMNYAGEQGIDSNWNEIFRFGPVGSVYDNTFGFISFHEPDPPHRFTQIADCGYEGFMAVKEDRSIWVWGYVPGAYDMPGYVDDQPNFFVADWGDMQSL